jgi:hypothetical protein
MILSRHGANIDQVTSHTSTSRNFAIAAAVASMIALAATAPGIPIVWDEGEYLWRADHLIAWFRLVGDIGNAQGGLHAFSDAVIRHHWMFITHSEGHPAWAVIPIAVTKALLTGILHPLTAARIGTIGIFSLACGGVAFRMRSAYGAVAATVAVIALVTFPRIFSEAHFATLDAQLTAWWLMLWAADASLRSDVRSTIGVGVLAGLTSATKFTGWLAWAPLVASRLLTRDRWRRLGLFIILPTGLVTFCLVNPPLWHHPLDGLITHFHLNLDRVHTFNITIAFLGRVYDMRHPLPWYNTIGWLVLVTPVPLLVLGAIGLIHCLRVRDAISISLVLHWATLMVIRALPNAPPHDGIRLFLPAFGFWCVFAGIGAQHLWHASRAKDPLRSPLLVRLAIIVALAADVITVARYYPQTLSHYSLLVGGVSGAARIGMEPTYWWDALDTDVLTWINENTEPGAAVAFSYTSNIDQLRAWGRLRVPQADLRRGVFKWYVLQNRTGFLGEVDRLLMRTITPAYTKFAGRRPAGSAVPPDLNVPLLLIFTGDEFKAAVRAVYGPK